MDEKLRESLKKRIQAITDEFSDEELDALLNENDVIYQFKDQGIAWRVVTEGDKYFLLRFTWGFDEDCTPQEWELVSELEF